jgi:hypothetical protein
MQPDTVIKKITIKLLPTLEKRSFYILDRAEGTIRSEYFDDAIVPKSIHNFVYWYQKGGGEYKKSWKLVETENIGIVFERD